CTAMSCDEFEEALSKIGELAFPDAANTEECDLRSRPDPGHFMQSRIAEQDVSGHVPLVGDLPPQSPKALEQSMVNALPRLFVEAGLADLSLWLQQPHGAFAAQHVSRRVVESKNPTLFSRAVTQGVIQELVEHIDQCFAVRALHQTVGAKLLVAPAANALGVGAQQHVHNMLGAKALARTRHAGEDLLRSEGRIREPFHF